MTGSEAFKIREQLDEIYDYLLDGNDRRAFYYLGRLTEELSQIVLIDQCSFNPTVPKDYEE